jgi:hypothetical protein
VKKGLVLILILSLAVFSKAQVLCIRCYDQNVRVLTDTNNLIVNGGFENTPCLSCQHCSFCPNSFYYTCDIANWLCTGGGLNTYAHIMDTATSNLFNKSIIVEGIKAVYFGNYHADFCSIYTSDTSCIGNIGCEVSGIPAGYPVNELAGYGGDTGVSLSQTVSGLTTGAIYLLEFWAGGERYYTTEGIFAVDVGFGNIFLKDPSTPQITGIGRRYIIVFAATASSHNIKFTNWGHYCNSCGGTELILDDVRMFAGNPELNICSVGINEFAQNAGLNFFPNPLSSNSEITFTYPSANGKREIIINDINGKETARYALPPNSSTQKVKLPQMAKGIYVARLMGENISANVKFVVQ